MPNAVIHPSAQELTAFALGKLPEAAASTIAGHLEKCSSCRKVVENLPADSFVGKVRAAKPGVSSLPARAGGVPNVAAIVNAPAIPPKGLPPDLANYAKYRFVRELGRGGMGVVYQAEQTVMGRTVAVKVINPSVLDHPEALPRFQGEVKAAAKLDHPNIVRAYDAEQVGDMHLLVMEFVEGTSLAELVAKKGPQPIAHACHYIRQAALGLQHAFEQGMVHRDIKPQNLMVNARGQVKVLDFGLARMRSERKAGGGLTQADAFMGTPEYVAPEQATDARSADTRADIYSLGCTLFFLLTGRPPFQGDMAVKLILAHIEKEPPALHEVRADVPGELSAVVARMLAKDPAQRFQTPLEVAQELTAFVKATTKRPASGVSASASAAAGTGTVIAADTSKIKAILSDAREKTSTKKASAEAFEGLGEGIVSAKKKAKPARRAVKPVPAVWYRRWPVLAGVGAAVLALGLGVWLLAGVVFKTKVKTPNGEAYVVLEIDQPDAEVTVDGQKMSVQVPGDNKPVEIKVETGRPHKLRVRKDGFEVVSRDVELQSGKSAPIRVRLEPVKVAIKREEQPAAPPPAPPADGFMPRFKDYDRTGGYRYVHFGKDETRVVLRFNDSEQKQYFARVYDLATGQALTLPLKHERYINHASFSPDGQRVVTASSDNTARLWDAATGKEVTSPLQHENNVVHGSFSPDGRRVITTSFDKTARLWDVATGKEVTPPLQHKRSVFHGSFSPDGQRVVTTTLDGTARLWDAATGKELISSLKHDRSVEHASFSPDGTRVVTASRDGTARLWDAATGKEVTPPLQHENWVCYASFSPDGQRVVTASHDKTARLWDATTGQVLTPPLKHEDFVTHASFSPDGRRVITASKDHTARLWDATTGQALTPPLQHEGSVAHASFNPDGQCVVTTSEDKTARLWDAATGKELKKVTIAATDAGPAAGADGFVPLFNSKDLTGWKTHPDAAGDWKVEKGILIGRGPKVSHLYSQRGDYVDFHLIVEAKINQGGNSGVLFHKAFTPDWKRGYEAQIDSSSHKFKTGTLYVKAAPGVGIEKVLVPTDTWFTQEVIVQGNHIIIKIDGVKTVDFVDVDNTWPGGHIALQVFDAPTVVQFRRIEIKELPAAKSEAPPAVKPEAPPATRVTAEEKGFVPLFNGKTLNGWKTHPTQRGNWRVEKGILVGSGPRFTDKGRLIGSSDGVSHLYTNRGDYTDFHLRLEARINERGNSGVYFRAPFGPNVPANVRMPMSPSNKPTWIAAYNAKIHAPRFGGLLIDPNPELHRRRQPVLQPGEWLTYEVIVEGNHIVIKVNGQTTADYTDEQRRYTKGHIVLQQHGTATVVEFRKIEIKELPAKRP